MDSTYFEAARNQEIGPLGITTKLTGVTPQERLVDRYSTQSVARRILPAERVAGCLRAVVSGPDGPTIWYSEERHKAKYGGLMICGSVWMCPVCAAHISEFRRNELGAVVASARELGYIVELATFTAAHQRGSDLGDLVAGIVGAYGAMKNGGYLREMVRSGALAGSVKAVEVTWGESNGWHPHLHVLMIRRPGIERSEFEQKLKVSWLGFLERKGLTASLDRGVTLQVAGDEVDRYIAKFGHEPTRRLWGAGDEMAKWHSKRAGKVKDGEQRFTPFDLLRWYLETGEGRPAALFREYAGVFKGRHQLQWSRGLRELLALDEGATDAEAAAWIDETYDALSNLTPEEWRYVLKTEQRGQLLALVGALGMAGLEEFRRTNNSCHETSERAVREPGSEGTGRALLKDLR